MRGAPHVPVLKDETLGFLKPGPGKRIVDGTFGFGGHSVALLESGAEVLGLDLDGVAVGTCRRISADRHGLTCQQISFRHLDQALARAGWESVDGVLLDLGVNSQQLDDPAKGFSYRADGPLDLRFDQSTGTTAGEYLATATEAELAEVIWRFGEERASRQIARTIVAARKDRPLTTTAQLADAVRTALPPGRKPMPVLSRVFQALRIKVNDELAALQEALGQLPRLIVAGGNFVIISYHSLEDRLVKQFIATEQRDCICPTRLPECVCGHQATLKALVGKAVKATPAERQANPRARSARLRAATII